MEDTDTSSSGKVTKGYMSKSPFSTRQIIIFVAAFGLIGYLVFRSLAATTLVGKIEAEQMKLPRKVAPSVDTSASGGQTVKLTSNGSLSGTINLTSPASSFALIARANQCGNPPSLSVSIDGAVALGATNISSSGYTDYTATKNLGSGNHTVTISANVSSGKGKRTTTCVNALYIDVLNFFGPDTPPPLPPTVALSASPTSANFGQSSTLTWNSTNTNSCTASGAWSGAQPVIGSVSTGALNQTSTYSLTCWGDGGSASASTTVTVLAAQVPSPPTIYLNPINQSLALGSTFTVEVRENSGNTGVNAVQANFSYPADKMTLANIDSSASAFGVEAQSTGSAGQVTLARGICGGCAVVTGDQLIAKVTFIINQVAGTANLTFTDGSALVSSTTNQSILPSLSKTGSATYSLQ